MYATLVCDPPLGRPFVTAESSVTFTVIVEGQDSSKAWEIALWHNLSGEGSWNELLFADNAKPSFNINEEALRDQVCRQSYTATLEGRPENGTTVYFTVKFRSKGEKAWKWANSQFDVSDGQIIYQPSAIPEQELGFYFENTSGDLKFSKESSDTPETSVWSLTGTVDGATNTASGHTTHLLGKPRNSAKWFALVRIWSPWLAPRQGDGDFSPDKEVVLASFLRQDGYHVVVLALSGIDDVLTLLNHDKSGGVTINARNDSPSPGTARVIVAVGRSFETANSAAMYFARRLVTKYEVVNGQIQAEIDALTQGDDVNVTWLERWYDGLAYCTWNGIGQHLTEDKILEALDSLRKSGVQITNLIIDDNWQSIDDVDDDVKTGTWRDQFRRGWKEFEANKEGFPNGLRATVTRIRREHDNIQHVAVWHALFGYWGGISPDGKIAKEYKVQTVQKKDGVSGGSMIAVSADDVQRFYNDFYSFLRSTGVDSVKTDAQFLLDELVDAPDRHALIREYQDAWSIANLRYFRAKAISCMSQTPQILFHSQMPTNRPRLLVRNSDDFFPDVPASHPWHIFCNAHNALFAQHLNVLPDWDMFQTSHPWASFHAAARCVSGGPIYITDIPGKHDLNLINQISAQTPRGETTILRPSVIGKSMNAYAGFGDKVLLKVGTYVGFSQTGTGILGVFNTTQHPLTEIIRLSDIPGTETGEYVIRSYITGKVTSPMKARDKDALVSVALDVQKWEILSAYAIKEFKLERKHEASGSLDVKVANLGLLGKMTGAAAVINSDMYVDKGSGRLRIWTSLKALGTYGLYISDLANRSLNDDFMAVLFGRPIPPHCIKKNEKDGNILEIDVARAWKESNQRAGWSNEVAVEIVVR